MKSAEEQLSTYKSLHLNANNMKTHFIGIPLIVSAILIFLSLIRLPLPAPHSTIYVPIVYLTLMIVITYYFLLHYKIAVGMVVFFIPLTYAAQVIASTDYAWLVIIITFVNGWVLQLLGHFFEKARPAFVDDMNQLLIGPFFLMAELFFILGLEKNLEQAITPKAIEKRRLFEKNRA